MSNKTIIPENLLPPQNIEAEMCVLGAMILSDKACEEVLTLLQEQDFYLPPHHEIFNAIRQLLVKRSVVDLVTLKNELVDRDKLTFVGGIDYLVQLAESVPATSNVHYYAQIVLDKATDRRLIQAGESVSKVARNTELTSEEKVEAAESLVFEVAKNRNFKYFVPLKQLTRTFFEDIDELYEHGKPQLGISSGYVDLDRMTGGFYPSDLVIVAARPSMGKTALVLNFGVHVAQQKKGAVAVFSLEMSGNQLIRRMVSTMSGVSMGIMKRPNMTREQYDKIGNACENMFSLPIYIDDSSDISPLELRGKCRRLKQEHGLSMIIIDYLQLMRGPRRTENRVQEISDIVRGLKAIAKEFDVSVVALSQLNRGVESREDKRPMLSDIRESGSIEAEADIVMFIYRDAYYKAKEAKDNDNFDVEKTEETEIIIAKHRNGPTGKVFLAYQPHFSRFLNLQK